MEIGILYESRAYGNCVFVGRDKEGVPRYAFLRGTWSDFKCEAEGSTKRYGFMIPRGVISPCETSVPPDGTVMQGGCESAGDREDIAVGIFESPIDALSHATLYPGADMHRLSLGGTSSKALMQLIADDPSVRTVYACLDSDGAGRNGTEKIRAMMPGAYVFHDRPPPEGKDYNDFLRLTQRRARDRARDAALSR